MKEITLFEEARNNPEAFKENGINHTLYWAYNNSKEAGNDLIDFSEVIWDYDIPEIAAVLKEEGITEFTISSTFSSLIETLAAFEAQGITMAGLTQVKARYTDWQTGEHKIIPAIKMSL
jgi:predicted ATP-grasp superfamily ATP-dependent carboligase